MGLILRRLSPVQNRIYLTFDDGPDPRSTERVLETLRRHQVPATFFVIGDRMREYPELIERIRHDGHSIGNHSLDHGYRPFFQTRSRMRHWVQQSEDVFREQGVPSAGFRPPAGVVTPALKDVLRDMGLPLVLWDLRFFDTVLPWNRWFARLGLRLLRPGSVILLHDRQKAERIDEFCRTLSFWIQGAREKGFEFAALKPQEYGLTADG